MTIAAEDVLNFWFYEVGHDRWMSDDRALDTLIRDRFQQTYEIAAAGGLKEWENTPEGMLALMLLLDQFPRRMFRGTSRAFETDEMALDLAREAIIKHFDDRIDKGYKMLFYLPFLNSEDEGNQRLALFYIRERAKEDEWLKLAERNYETILRFGRLPERNPVLGRQPTPEEDAYLKAANGNRAH